MSDRETFKYCLQIVAAAAVFAALGSAQTTGPDISNAWDTLLAGPIPSAEADPALVVDQVGTGKKATDDFLNHFFFDSQTQYIHQNTAFTGLSTPTGVIDAPASDVVNPAGIPYSDAFQPSTNHFYTFLNFGTRGWKSKRVNTNFSARYRQDLSNVADGSPTQRIINSFFSDRRIEVLNANLEVNGLGSSKLGRNSSIKFGRQHIYGAEVASFDGGSLTLRQSRFNLTLYGGRRFTYFSDPRQRAIGGGNLLLRLTEKTSLEYQTLFYVRASHVATLRHRITPDVRFTGRFKAVGGSAVDLSGDVLYLPSSGKSMLRVGVWQKLSDDDFAYDYTLGAEDRNPARGGQPLMGTDDLGRPVVLQSGQRLPRLFLGVIPKYTQATFSGRQEIIPKISLGGGVIIRRLNDADQTLNAYAASFEDYRISSQIFPTRHYELMLELHQRNVDRGNPLGATAFDDITIAGETRAQDASFEIRRAFGEGKLTLTGGAFYRRMNLQNRFFFIEGQRAFGVLGGASYRVNTRAWLTADWSLDDDFFIFRPSIQRSQVLRLGWRWRY